MAGSISKELALRIGLAARALPDTDAKRLMSVLLSIVPPPFDELKFEGITVKQLKTAADGELSGIDTPDLKKALAYLKGEIGADGESAEPDLPALEAYADGDMPGSIRVAIASNSDEMLDGHFGSCARFLVYQVSTEEARLIDLRSAGGHGAEDDKNAFRAGRIADCQVLYVNSVGGPAAAKVVKKGIYPIKQPAAGPAREAIARLQEVLAGDPPPWLAKIMGADPEERIRCTEIQLDEEDAA